MDKTTEAINKTPSDLIRNIITSYTFIDFGIVTKFSNTTVDIDLVNKRSGFTVHLTKVELLTLGSATFSLNIEPVAGDIVMLLGTRQYIESLGAITKVQDTSSKLSYDLECLKAVQIAPAKSSKVTMNIDKNGKVDLTATGDININSNNNVNIRGSGKTFTLFAALKSAIEAFINALNTHTHSASGSGPPSVPMSLNIDSAESQHIFTDG